MRLGRDFHDDGEVVAGVRVTFNVIADMIMTLPKGQLVRPEWPRSLAMLALVFANVRSRVTAEKVEEAARAAQRAARR